MYLAEVFLVFLKLRVERWEENKKRMAVSWDVLKKAALQATASSHV